MIERMLRVRTWGSALMVLVGVAACSSSDDAKGGALTVTIAGDEAARTGFAFPPAPNAEAAFVDGWDVVFDRILVTVDGIVISEDPDRNPTDQSAVGGVVARASGPWAIDVSKPGKPAPGLATGGSDSEGTTSEAQALVRIAKRDDGKAFDPSSRYAFGYEVVAANASAKKTNFDAIAEADYADMVAKGISVLYVGTATFKGTSCTSSDASYDFTTLPSSVKFRFGFRTPTRYTNCQNTSLRGRPFDGEEAQRGVQVAEGGDTVAQMTIHVDHPFWNTVDHDAAEIFFDQFAAAATADGTVTLDDLASVDFSAFQDRAKKNLPWRSCIADKPAKAGTRAFDSGSVPIDPNAAPESALRSYADYVAYQQSTQGHLNADGLCAITRLYPAPR